MAIHIIPQPKSLSLPIPSVLWTFTMGLALIFGACQSLNNTNSPNRLPTAPAATVPNPPIAPNIIIKEYRIDPIRWGIYTDSSHAIETTDGINAAIVDAKALGYTRVRLSAGKYLIGKTLDSSTQTGIKLVSDMALVMDSGAILEIAPNNRPIYYGIDLNGLHNVEISGGEIHGDRLSHNFNNPDTPDESTHEFGYLIYVHGSFNTPNCDRISIHDIKLHDATGDGICIEAFGDSASNTNIRIFKTRIFDNRRQGISIVGGSSILIDSNEIYNIRGTSPQFGIDIESENHKSQNIVISANFFHDNAGGDLDVCDGFNIWFKDNICEQGINNKQTDGPVVFWKKAQITIQHNTITMAVGSSNGKLGILDYNLGTSNTQIPTVIADNTLNNCGILATNGSHFIISGNTVSDYFIWAENINDLDLSSNTVTATDCPPFVLRNVSGKADGNIQNGANIEFPLTQDRLYSH